MNKLMTVDEFVAEIMRSAREHAAGDQLLKNLLIASMGAALNGPGKG